MSNRKKRWIAVAGAALAALAVVLLVRSGGAPPAGKNRSSDDGTNPRLAGRDYPGHAPGTPSGEDITRHDGAATAAASDHPSVEKQIESLMATWRNAILVRDADTVVAVDGALRHEPKKFLPALMKSAETDEDARVRAFSTRVLGKLLDPECGPLLTRLLDDRNQYVRMNAAWGLGELANTPAGRPAARAALDALHRIERKDSFEDARAAAALAAKRLM